MYIVNSSLANATGPATTPGFKEAPLIFLLQWIWHLVLYAAVVHSYLQTVAYRAGAVMSQGCFVSQMCN